MSLHLPSKTLMLLSLPRTWKRAGDGFLSNLQDIVSESAGILPLLCGKICFWAWLWLRSPSLYFQEEQRFLTGHSGLLDGSSSSLMNKSSWSYLKILSVNLYGIKKSSGNSHREERRTPYNRWWDKQVFCSVCCKNTAHLALSECVGAWWPKWRASGNMLNYAKGSLKNLVFGWVTF